MGGRGGAATARLIAMTFRRLAALVLLLLLAGVPLAEPLLELLRSPERFEAWSDSSRLLSLAANTTLLIAGTLALGQGASRNSKTSKITGTL